MGFMDDHSLAVGRVGCGYHGLPVWNPGGAVG